MKKKLLSLLLMMSMFCSVFASAALAASVEGTQYNDTAQTKVKVEDVKEGGVNKLKVTVNQGNTDNIKYNVAVVLVTEELRGNYADIDAYLTGDNKQNLADVLDRDSLSNQASISELTATGGTGSATFTITTDFEAGSYYVVVWGDGYPSGAGLEVAVAADGSIKLDPSNAPTINTQPADAAVTVKTSHTLSIAATGDGTLTYQWQKKDAAGAWKDISGATNATYQLANNNYTAAMAGDYRCVVTNTATGKAPKSVESNAATITTTKIAQTPTLTVPTGADAKYGVTGKKVTGNRFATTPATTGAITYTSSDASVATVNLTTGALEYKKPGTTTITMNVAADNNYEAGTATETLTVGKGTLTAPADLAFNVKTGATYADVVCNKQAANFGGNSVTGTYTLTGVTAGDTVAPGNVTWKFTPAEHADYYEELTGTTALTMTAKDPNAASITKDGQAVTKLTVPYGTADFTLGATATANAANATWTSGTPATATVDATGKVSIVKVGTTIITLTVPENDDYEAATATLELTVEAAELDSVDGFTMVKEAGKTLADVKVGAIGHIDGQDIAGSITWTDGATDATEVEKNKEYKFTFTPDDTNYAAFNGTIKPWKASSGNIGGGSSSSKTYTVTYDAGRRGEASRTSENVKSNAYPNKVPTVKANEGYEFKGWSLDGKTIVDPTDIRIKEDTTFTAIYESTKTADLNKDDHIAYIRGYEDGTFAPNKSITRAEAITIFARLMTEKMDVDATYSSSFSDVKAGAWYANYIGYMEDYNIINGYEDGTFRPDAAITRAEFAAMASRFDKLENTDKNVFTDVAASHWAINSINSAYAKGWIGGYPDGTFRPNQNISRAEVVSIVNNMLEREIDAASIADAQYKTFPDVAANHWAYYDVIEAANEHDYTKDGNKETWK